MTDTENAADITIVTGNIGKYEEVKEFFKGTAAVDHISLDLTEIKGDDVGEIAHFKAHEAYQLIRKPVIVDDTGFFINGLNGFPGAYAAFVQKTIGNIGILSLLAGMPDRSAYFETAIAYADENGIKVFKGRVDGTVTKVPRGSEGFGYDPIFEYEGETFAEMSMEKKTKVSHRSRALAEFRDWYMKEKRG